MTEILDVVKSIVLLPYYITKAVLTFLLANIIILIVLISIIIIITITIIAIFPGFFLKIILGMIFQFISTLLVVASVLTGPFAILFLPLLIIINITGPILMIVNRFSWSRLLMASFGSFLFGGFILGWAIGEAIEASYRKPDFNEFAQHIQGTLTAYDGKGASDRHRAAIAIKPGSKYYTLALSMSEKDDINKTDSGKFWVTQEIPDVVFLFNKAYENLNVGPFYK